LYEIKLYFFSIFKKDISAFQDYYTHSLKTLDPAHHKEERLVLRAFAVCRTENVLHEVGISTLAEIKEQNTTRTAIRVITHESHTIRSYFMNNKIHDEYPIKPRTIKPIFIRAIEYFWVNYR
jgi:hypothetical protein